MTRDSRIRWWQVPVYAVIGVAKLAWAFVKGEPWNSENRKERMPQYILYTYFSAGNPQCHAYGPGSQADCQALAEKQTAEHAADQMTQFTTMVLPLEAMPA